jgi:RNA polymerase sigma-70 factor (ECF subfamily)
MGAQMTRSRLRPLLSGVVLRSQSDARLGQLAGDGHQLAFTTIFERYQRELEAHAARIVRPSRAEDVVQHAMLNAWSALLSGEVVAEPRAWLHRIVHNVALNTVARRGYDDTEIPETTASPILTHDIAESRMSAAEALAAVAALPEAQRRALALTAFEGRSGAEAAAELGLSESAMRQLVYRARNGVRSAVSAVTPLPLITSALQGAGAGAGGAATVGGVSTGGALSGLAAKTAVVLAVGAGGVGATAAVSHNNDRQSATRHAQTISTTATTLAAPAPTGAVLRTKQVTHPAARSTQRSHSGGSQGGPGQHGSAGTHDNRGKSGHSNTSGGTSGGASRGSTGTQGSSGANENGSTSPNSPAGATPQGSQGTSVSDSSPRARSTIPAPLQPNEPNASTSPAVPDTISPAPTGP